MIATTVMSLVTDGDGSVNLKCERLIAGNRFELGCLKTARLPRKDCVDPRFVLAAGLTLFGQFCSGELILEFDVPPRFCEHVSGIFGVPISVNIAEGGESGIELKIYEEERTRELVVSEELALIGAGDMYTSNLVVLPGDGFYGSLGSMFSMAISSNAAYESDRVLGSFGTNHGLVAVGLLWAPAYLANQIRLLRVETSSDVLDQKVMAVIASLGMKVETDAYPNI